MQKDEANRLGETMAHVFFDDPIMSFIEPDESKRLAKGRSFMSSGISYAARWGEVYTDDEYRGGAAWLTPGDTSMTMIRTLRTGTWLLPFQIGFRSFLRFSKLGRVIEKAHKLHVPGEHWYLMMIGTHPDHQGSGMGSALLQTGMSKAAEAGLPVYLETMTEENVDFYLKRDFKVVEEILIDDQLKSWAMIHQPE